MHQHRYDANSRLRRIDKRDFSSGKLGALVLDFSSLEDLSIHAVAGPSLVFHVKPSTSRRDLVHFLKPDARPPSTYDKPIRVRVWLDGKNDDAHALIRAAENWQTAADITIHLDEQEQKSDSIDDSSSPPMPTDARAVNQINRGSSSLETDSSSLHSSVSNTCILQAQ